MKQLDDIRFQRISRDKLRQQNISYEDLGIRLNLVDAKSVYFDKTGISIEMNDGTYLDLEGIKQYVKKNKKLDKNNSFESFTP